MAERFSEHFRSLRTSRGVTLAGLAARAALARRTLLYWEAGTFLPRLPELETALAALEASPAERTRMLAALGRPRADRRLATERAAPAWEHGIGPAPRGGDLLRALRRRERLSLGQAALRLAVAPSTLSRWEQGRVVPPPERLPELLTALGASPGERAALQDGLLFLDVNPAPPSPEGLREAFEAFHNGIYARRTDRLNDLCFLTYIAQAHPGADGGAAGREFLASVYAAYASHLADLQRSAEAGEMARRSLTLLSGPAAWSETALRATLAAAHAAVYGGRRVAPALGGAALRPWSTLPLQPALLGWVQADMARYLALHGAIDGAMALSLEACRTAERCADSNELRLRRIDRAKLLVRHGDPEQGLSLVAENTQDSPFRRADVRLLLAEGLLAVGDGAGARHWLAGAYEDITAGDLGHLRAQADVLARRL